MKSKQVFLTGVRGDCDCGFAWGRTAGWTIGAYSAAKAGVVALTKAIADETKGTNITANTALPSAISPPKNCSAMGSENAHQWVKPQSLA